VSKEDSRTMWINIETKKKLDQMKLVPQEPYDSVIRRLIALSENQSVENMEAEQ
jgi:hypothetical protein